MTSRIEHNIDLAPRSTLGVAARAAHFCAADSVESIREALDWAAEHRHDVLVVGGCSNIVFAGDYAGLVLQPSICGREKIGETAQHHLVRAGAGENWHETVAWTLAQGWPGLENLALIPGCVGAAPVQNIGAYGLELTDCFHSLEALDRESGEVRILTREACRFAYRDSIFKHPDGARLIVLNVTFALPKAWSARAGYRDLSEELARRGIAAPSPQDIFDAVVAVRQRKLPDPAVVGNVGSFFKNPIVSAAEHAHLRQSNPTLVSYPQADGRFKLAAGWLIDQAGWKGRTMGRARVHPTQALVLTNTGGASGQEVLALAHAIQADIQQRFGVSLEAEPIVVGASRPN